MFDLPPPKKRKKVDYEALHSPLKRIPGLTVADARDLIDLGMRQVIDLHGRSPEALIEDLTKIRPAPPPPERLWAFRLAVYFAETDEPDPTLLAPWCWQDRRI